MKILVATDGSRAGSAALRFASRLADTHAGSELVVLSVDAERHPPVAGRKNARPSQAQRTLEDAAHKMRRRAGSSRFRNVAARRSEEVPDVISREADRMRADMVVVGSEGRDSLSEWIVGGTALRLIYVARRPVTVVRAPRRRKAR